MVFELTNTTATLLAEIADKRMTRDDVAKTYALTICSSDQTAWHDVNRAIRDRWSKSALVYIKEKAWKLAEGGDQ